MQNKSKTDIHLCYFLWWWQRSGSFFDWKSQFFLGVPLHFLAVCLLKHQVLDYQSNQPFPLPHLFCQFMFILWFQLPLYFQSLDLKKKKSVGLLLSQELKCAFKIMSMAFQSTILGVLQQRIFRKSRLKYCQKYNAKHFCTIKLSLFSSPHSSFVGSVTKTRGPLESTRTYLESGK